MMRMHSIAKKSVFSRQLILRDLYDISSLKMIKEKDSIQVREYQAIKL